MTLTDLINQLPTKFKPSILRERCKKAGVKLPCPLDLTAYGLRRSSGWLLKDSHPVRVRNYKLV